MPALRAAAAAWVGWAALLSGKDDLFNLPHLNRATVAGISVAIAGNVLISLALNCQKLAHRRLELQRSGTTQEADRRAGDGRSAINGGNALGITEEEDTELAGMEDASSPLNGQEVVDEDESFSSAPAVLETAPLLSSGQGTPIYGSHEDGLSTKDRKPPWSSRLFIWRKRARKFASDAEHAHLGTTHSLVPVDVVAARPKGPRRESSGQDDKADEHRNEGDYLKSKLWWLGFTLMNVGEIGNFISYGFAPASVVAPLGTFALVANCIFAPLMLKERFRKRDFLGIMIAIVGAVTVVLSANPSDTKLNPDSLIQAITQKVFIAYTSIYIALGLILSGLSEGSIGQRYVYVDVGLCAIFGGFTVLSTKAFSSLLTREWFGIFKEWITYPVLAVLIGTGVGQIRYLNRALMRFDSKIVVPSQFVMFNLSAIVGSAILYGDFRRATFHQIVTFLYGCAATFAGVFLIAWAHVGAESPAASTHDAEAQDDVESTTVAGDPEAAAGQVRFGSLGRRNRATLVIPESAVENATGTPILRNKRSVVSMIGLSPAQRLLLVHASPREEYVRPLAHDYDSDTSNAPHDYGRRRTMSWVGEGSPAQRGGRRRVQSTAASREVSQSRPPPNVAQSPS